MQYKMNFNLRYFITFIVLLITEILIALFVHDTIIRPYVGDLLVVILIYAFIKSFIATPPLQTAVAVLAFAFTIELLQYFNIVNRLGLQHSKIARIIIGTSFSWHDLLAYTAGFALIVLAEYRKKKNQLLN